MSTDEEALARKKRVRGAHRASTTRLMGQAEALMAERPVKIDELSSRQTSLSKKAKILATLDDEIIDAVDDDQLEEEIGRADEYSEQVQRILLKIERLLMTAPTASGTPTVTETPHTPPIEPVTTDGESRDQETEAGSREAVSCGPTAGRVKLPKITLPHFRGNPLQWTAFWDSYESAVHLNDSLSEVDKFNYLKSLLEKAAYDAVAGLTLSAANYCEAVDILKRRFGNRQIIVSRHMETLLNLTAVSGDHDLKGLRRLYNEVEANVRSLKALGVSPDSYGAMLTSVLLMKLPPEVRLIISRKVTEDELNLETLLAVWEEELIVRERAQDPTHSKPVTEKRKHPSTAATLISGTSDASGLCCYCQNPHSATSCSTVTDLDARRGMLRSGRNVLELLSKGAHWKKMQEGTPMPDMQEMAPPQYL